MSADQPPIENRTAKESFTEPATKTDSHIGKIIDGCRLTHLIARGGMGRVYRARHLVLGKDVAIKVLSEDMATDREYINRFLTEAKIAASLEHQNIVQVHDVGKEQGVYFIHMQFIEGKSVSELMDVHTTIDEISALRIVAHTASGLAFAHERNIIHRDIKPGNIIIDLEGNIKIADFGLAKNLQVKKGHTVSGQVLGTPYFMSPEQCKGGTLDHRTDQYSLGAMLYYMITGAFPFDAEETLTVMRKHLDEQISFDLPDIHISTEVRGLIETMMEKKIDQRFSTTDALAENVVSILRTLQQPATAVSAPPAKINVAAISSSFTLSSADTDSRPCPACAEPIRQEASKCMHCGEHFHSSQDHSLVSFQQRILGLAADLAITCAGAYLLDELAIVYFIGFPVYFIVMLGFNSGQTLGMMLTKHRIVTEAGDDLDLQGAIQRTLFMLLSFLLFGTGFLLPAFREDRKSLHDLMANTKAISTKS